MNETEMRASELRENSDISMARAMRPENNLTPNAWAIVYALDALRLEIRASAVQE